MMCTYQEIAAVPKISKRQFIDRLSKQYLGERDQVESQVTGAEGGPIKITLGEMLSQIKWSGSARPPRKSKRRAAGRTR